MSTGPSSTPTSCTSTRGAARSPRWARRWTRGASTDRSARIRPGSSTRSSATGTRSGSQRAKDLHSQHYREQSGRLRAFEHAADLLRELASRGIRVVLATSAPEDELKLLMETLDADDAIHATTNADDVETAKPEPGIIEVALQRAGAAPPTRCSSATRSGT